MQFIKLFIEVKRSTAVISGIILKFQKIWRKNEQSEKRTFFTLSQIG